MLPPGFILTFFLNILLFGILALYALYESLSIKNAEFLQATYKFSKNDNVKNNIKFQTKTHKIFLSFLIYKFMRR